MMIFALLAFAAASDDVLIADFEGETYAGWVATGAAFGEGPVRGNSGTLPGQMAVSGFEGQGLVNSYRGGDRATGTLTSPEFTINRKAITFLIGGGGWDGKTCVNLLVDGKVVRTATGPNTQPGGSEALERTNWDVGEFAGKGARIQIVDDAVDGWGHINADHFVLTDAPPPGVVASAARSITAQSRYLHLPIKEGAPVRRLSLHAGSTLIRDFEAAITEGDPDFWAFIDIAAWKGSTLEIRGLRLPQDGAALGRIEQSDQVKLTPGAEPLYAERLRPQFHFSTRRGWINDPNGMVYANGEYHLYYQHNPYGWGARNMHWGHAVSTDLVHWTELPTALAPHSFGDWVWSGSAVVDSANTSGWKARDTDVIVAAYTSTARGECIVYSNDHGRTFKEFEGNPVVTHAKGEGRDPRLFWFAKAGGGGHWVMAVYNEIRSAPDPERLGVAFYTSPDLKVWTYTSRIGGFYECPDIFELPIDGGKNGSKWVLTAANSEYLLGQFDGEAFTPDQPVVKLPGNRSERFYAAQTFSQTPDGRRIQIGWGRIETRGMPFNQMMSFPCELTLRTTPEGVRMFAWPVREIEGLRGQVFRAEPADVSPGKPLRLEAKSDLLDVQAVVEPRTAAAVELDIRGMRARLDLATGRLSCGGRYVPVSLREGRVSIRVLADRTSLEVFVNDGEASMLLAGDFSGSGVSLACEGGTAHVRQLEAHELRSAWTAVP